METFLVRMQIRGQMHSFTVREPSIREASGIQASIQHAETMFAATESGKRRQEWQETPEGKSGKSIPFERFADLTEGDWIEFNERHMDALIRCAKLVTVLEVDGVVVPFDASKWDDASAIPARYLRPMERIFAYVLSGGGDKDGD
jgi:hypothetical protein